jgi:hypothetical protein
MHCRDCDCIGCHWGRMGEQSISEASGVRLGWVADGRALYYAIGHTVSAVPGDIHEALLVSEKRCSATYMARRYALVSSSRPSCHRIAPCWKFWP